MTHARIMTVSWFGTLCTAAMLLGAQALRWVMQDPYGIQSYHDRFDPTAALLARAIDEPVDLIPLAEDSAIVAMIANGSADLLYMGTTLFTCMQAEHGILPLAMIIEKFADHNITSLAGVVFTLANSTQIQVAGDLRNKVIGTGPLNYLSSFQLPWAYVQDHGLDLFADAAGVFLTDDSLAVVRGVADGTLDVGFTRAGYIERLQGEGQLPSGIFSYLDPLTWEGYPFATTTPLYPELVVAVMPHVAMSTRNRIAVALLGIMPEMPEAVVGQYTTWTTPPALIPTVNLQQRLGIVEFPFSACTTLFDIYSAIVCPSGLVRQSSHNLSEGCGKLKCPLGYTCVCRPCVPVTVRWIGALTLAQLVVTVCVVLAVACMMAAIVVGRWRQQLDLVASGQFYIDRAVIATNRHGCIHTAQLNGEAVLAERALPPLKGSHAGGSLVDPVPWTLRLLADRALRELALPCRTYSRASSVCSVASLQHELLVPCLGVQELAHQTDVVLLHPGSPRGGLHDLLVNKQVTMTLSLALSALLDIATVLAYLHSQGIVGMTTDSTYIEIDNKNRFCLRRSLPSGPTLTSAPELMRGEAHTMASDTFAFAMLMHEVLHGQDVYYGESAEAVIATIREAIRPGTEAKRPEIQYRFDAIPIYELMITCWGEDPGSRPSMMHVRDALAGFKDAETECKDDSSTSSYSLGMGMGGQIMQDDLYRDVSCVCFGPADGSQLRAMVASCEKLGLTSVPCREGWFFGVGNLNNDATHVQRVMRLALGTVSVPALAGVRCSAHVGKMCGRVIGEAYSLLGPDVTIATELCEASDGKRVLVSGAMQDRVRATPFQAWHSTKRPGHVKIRGVPDQAAYFCVPA